MRVDRSSKSQEWLARLLVVAVTVALVIGAAPDWALSATSDALRFSGSNQYVSFGRAAGLGASTFTLEVWFKREGTGVPASTGTGGVDAIPLVTKGRGEDDGSNVDMNYFLGIRASDGVLAADFEEGAGQPSAGLNHPITGVTPIALGTWYHAAVTYDGAKWQLFLNGTLERELVVGRAPRSDSIQHAALASALNSTGVPQGYFAGTLDEARIWSYARSASQVQLTMNQELASAPGLIGRWSMNEGSGTQLADTGSSGSTGSLINSPVWTTGYTFSPPTPDTTPPAAPRNLSAVAGNATVALSWTANSEPDLAGYNVYRGTTSPVSTSGAPLNAALLGSPSYTDASAANGTTYYYVVVAVDIAGNRSTASAEATASPFAPALKALRFNGSNQYVTFGNAAALGGATFTLELWFKRQGTGIGASTGSGGIDAIPLLSKGRSESDGSNLDMNYFLGIRASDGVLAADFEEGAGQVWPGLNHPITGVTPIALGPWDHAAVTYDGLRWQLFLNGALEGQLFVGRLPRSDSIQHAALASALNSTGAPQGYFAGTLDEARVWNYARTQAQIQGGMDQQIASAPGLVGRWSLDEGSGTAVSDSSGSGANGVATNGATWATAYPFGHGPAAPQLSAPANGANDLSASATLDVVPTDPDADAMSVTFYGRANTDPGFRVLGSRSGVASGTHATVSWTDLQPGTTYAWYATASDGVGTATSATWTFTTTGTGQAILVGAGDIASCSSAGDEATAALLDTIPGTVFALGDNAYDNGTPTEYANCYGPTWGRHKARTIPVPGNHDYYSLNAAGYFNYFGAAAGDPTKGYYSLDLGAWHIVVLNSNCAAVGGCGPGSNQDIWLRNDLAAHPSTCTLAMWHHPRWSSSLEHPSDMTFNQLWQDLYAYGADVVLNGHSHAYERFAPQDPSGALDTANGITEFIVGTGGESHGSNGAPIANSLARNGDSFGVLKLTLRSTSYEWQFVPQAGKTFTDSGTASCH